MDEPDAGSGRAARGRVLFVDDEPSVLDGLRRSLRRMREEWELTFIASPEQAAELAAREHFDVVVSDLRMPGMSGTELLERVREVSPTSVRIMLSGHGETSAIMKSVGPSHQFLTKPCQGEQLEAVIRRACSLRSALGDPRLAATLGKIRALPALPSTYQELILALQRDAPIDKIGEIIQCDVGLAAKILQLVNSSYFGLPRMVTDPARAVALLGSDTISSLVLGLKLFESLPPVVLPGMTAEQLMRDATWSAAAVRGLCALERVNDVFTAQAFVSALLHDVGLLTLAAYSPALLAQIGELAQLEQLTLEEAELRVLGTTHGDVGGYLAALWGFPDPVVESIVYHHAPGRSAVSELSPLTLVHVCQAHSPVREANPIEPEIDRDHLARVHVLDRLAGWLESMESLLH